LPDTQSWKRGLGQGDSLQARSGENDAGDLDAFARKLLTPLLEYDAANSSHLTDTFVLAKTLGSAQAVAERLGVHVNTIRYRLRRAEDLLGTDQTSPKEHAALVLAAFTW
jgi:DNA-binding PucR family transcriptional regulator